ATAPEATPPTTSSVAGAPEAARRSSNVAATPAATPSTSSSAAGTAEAHPQSAPNAATQPQATSQPSPQNQPATNMPNQASAEPRSTQPVDNNTSTSGVEHAAPTPIASPKQSGVLSGSSASAPALTAAAESNVTIQTILQVQISGC